MLERVLCLDIETIRSIFLVCAYDPQEDKKYQFEVSRRINQLDALMRWLETHEEYYFIKKFKGGK